MTDIKRQELYTLMDQWGRNKDILYQKVREWIETYTEAELAEAKRQMDLMVAKAELQLLEELRNIIPANPTYFWLHRINGIARRIAALESEGKAAHEQSAE